MITLCFTAPVVSAVNQCGGCWMSLGSRKGLLPPATRFRAIRAYVSSSIWLVCDCQGVRCQYMRIRVSVRDFPGVRCINWRLKWQSKSRGKGQRYAKDVTHEKHLKNTSRMKLHCLVVILCNATWLLKSVTY